MVVGDIDAGLGKAELQVKYGCTFEETAAFNRTKQFISKKLSVYKEKDMKISNSRQFTIERRRAIRSLRGLAEDDWDTIPPRPPTQNPAKPELTVGQIITKEMDEMVAKSKRRKDISALRNTRGKVRDHWQQMMNTSGMSGQAASAVPRWNEFASLPGVNSLLKPNDQDGGLDVEDLNKKDSTLAKMVQSNVDSWNSRTQGHFRKILKVPMPKKNEVPEPGTVPPLDRVTALFECTKCKNVGVGLAQEGTLTFKSAVKHRCPGTSAKNFQWTTELFKPDEYAIQVARHALALSGLAEDKTKRSDMDELGARFLCKLCTGKQSIHLNYCNLIGHVKRHIGQNLQGSFEYLSDPPQLDSDTPSSEGLVEKRRRGNTQGFASHPESKNIFTCRHCEKSMLWNALVSHVKAKHKFSDIRDEDFYPEPKED
ncbi:unnamed protein product [Rhizoctonia solani]|uniref:Uncharacterized protein n=1 Tax=Rhizoctonia solani TaxID=456999 RepID=A0A8H3ACS6_9AGAM|nr:unnamed protein product [Rhizoctonia solani]